MIAFTRTCTLKKPIPIPLYYQPTTTPSLTVSLYQNSKLQTNTSQPRIPKSNLDPNDSRFRLFDALYWRQNHQSKRNERKSKANQVRSRSTLGNFTTA